MASGLAPALKIALLDHVFRASSYTPLSTIYAELLSASATNYQTNTGGTPAAGLARLAIANTTTSWSAATSSANVTTKNNAAVFTFGTAPSTLTLQGIKLFDASTGGNYLGGGDLITPVTISTGSTIQIPVGSFPIRNTRNNDRGITPFLARKLLDLAFGATPYTAPATLYFPLYTAAPNYNAGTGGTEVTGGGYVQASLANNTTNWGAAGGSAKATTANTVAATYPDASASWGVVVAIGLRDGTAGNLLAGGTLTATRNVTNGSTEIAVNSGGFYLEFD